MSMEISHGRVDTYGKYLPYQLGDNQVKAMFGHVESGNVGAELLLPLGTYKFRALAKGHIFSLGQNQPTWTTSNPISVSYLPLTDEDSTQDFSGPTALADPSYGVHIPGGAQVTFQVDSAVRLIDERVDTRGNVPEVFDVIRRTPFIKQGSPLIKYLLPGDQIATAPNFVNEGDVQYLLHVVTNPLLCPDDRVILEIHGKGSDMCYLEGRPMEVEVLSGKGIVRLACLYDPNSASLDSNGPFMTAVEPIALEPGTKLTVPANTRIQYEATYGLLVIRDTSLGFCILNEVPTKAHFASVGDTSGPLFPALGLK